jgi:hypothetical protein
MPSYPLQLKIISLPTVHRKKCFCHPSSSHLLLDVQSVIHIENNIVCMSTSCTTLASTSIVERTAHFLSGIIPKYMLIVRIFFSSQCVWNHIYVGGEVCYRHVTHMPSHRSGYSCLFFLYSFFISLFIFFSLRCLFVFIVLWYSFEFARVHSRDK